MKVLWFSNTPANSAEFLTEGPVGGGWLKSLDKVLQEEVELHVAFYYPKKDRAFKYLKTTYHPISSGNWKLKAIKGAFVKEIIYEEDLPKYLKIINDVAPDIIHIHGTENPFSCIINHINIPVVVSIQGCLTVYSHKFLNGFSKSNLLISSFNIGKSFRQFLKRKSFIKTRREFERMKIREELNFKSTKYIIGRTSWDRRITSILAPDRTYFHCDEMMRESFYSNRWELKKSDNCIIHSTISNSTFKGFETICEAIFELNQLSDMKVIWQIAGISAEDSIVKVTKNKLRNRFPKTGILYLGSLSESQLVRKMIEANIFVIASHIENSPNSLCEAMLLGMPCIATFSGGTGSLIDDKKEGILIQDGDPWALAGAVLELYRNPEEAIHYGSNAHERAMNRHSKSKIVTDLINIYNEIKINFG